MPGVQLVSPKGMLFIPCQINTFYPLGLAHIELFSQFWFRYTRIQPILKAFISPLGNRMIYSQFGTRSFRYSHFENTISNVDNFLLLGTYSLFGIILLSVLISFACPFVAG